MFYKYKKLKFGIEQEARPLPEVTKQRADWTIRYIKNGDPKKVILMEDKRKGMETQSAEWHAALTQLTRYMKLECIDYPGTNGKCYELAENEEEIHAILLDLVQKTSHWENTSATSSGSSSSPIQNSTTPSYSSGPMSSVPSSSSCPLSPVSSVPSSSSYPSGPVSSVPSSSSYSMGLVSSTSSREATQPSSIPEYFQDETGYYYLHSNGAKIYWSGGKYWYISLANQWVEYTGA